LDNCRYLLPYVPFRKENEIAETKALEGTTEGSSNVDAHNDGPPKKKRERGMNKNRPRNRNPSGIDKICRRFLECGTCQFGDNCNFSHDVQAVIDNRPPDLGEKCVNFEVFGKCPYGVACRFGKEHITEDFKNITKETFSASYLDQIKNSLTKSLQVELRKKRIPFPRSDEYLREMKKLQHEGKALGEIGEYQTSGVVTDEDVIKSRSPEKKTVLSCLFLPNFFEIPQPCRTLYAI
jgi:tRNA-dihydrouridine synthase 3